MKTFLVSFFIVIQSFLSAQMTVTTSSGTTILTAGGGSPSSCAAGNFKLVGSATVAGASVTMTPANFTDNAAAMWSCNAFKLDSSFKVTATVTFGSNTALGDGIVFALKTNNSGNRMGRVGGFIGYHNTTASGTPIGMSLGVEFDTYNAASGLAAPDANGDSGPLTNCNHAQIVRDGDLMSKVGGQTCLKADGTSVNDGLSHTICITWVPPTTLAAGGTFTAYLDGRVVATTGDIRGYIGTGSTDVYWGFTAGDGAGTNLNTHIISDATIIIKDARKIALAPSCVVPLPVELSRFETITNDEKSNLISWTTSSERDNDFFTLEKSKDGINFELLTKVNGSGNSSQTNNYEFIDDKPYETRTYYKLSQTDFNGTSQLLGVQVIENENYEFAQVVKNPFEDNCKLQIKSKSNATKLIAVYDITGKNIYTDNLIVNQGMNDFEIDFSKQENGMYMVSVSDHNKTDFFKVLKLKN
jgi:hypothetical protein